MVDIFLTKDEKIADLEKRIKELDRKVDYNFGQIQQSFDTLKEVLIKVQLENKDLKKDRDFLMEKYREVLRSVPGNYAVGDRIIRPIKNEIRETSGLIKDIALEGFGTGEENIDGLFELVMNKKSIEMKKAAKQLGVSEKKTRYWALALEKKGLIKMQEGLGKTVLTKK